MSPLPGGLAKTAAFTSQQIQAAVMAQARKVERLGARRRKARRIVRELDDDWKRERRFLKAMVRDLRRE